MPKVKLLVNSWKRTEKDEDGNTVRRRYRRDDVIDVTDREARVLLREVDRLGPVAEKYTATEESKSSSQTQNVQRSSTGTATTSDKKS